MIKARKFETIFLKKEKINKETFSFYFSTKDLKFNFNPGQYIKMYLDIPNSDSRGTSRYFTISSSPLEKEFIAITTRIIKSSFKLKLVSLKPGETVSFFGPLGYFNFDTQDKNQQVFLAGGIGVTPFHSILKYVTERKIKSKIILIASFSNKKDIVFYDELKNIENKNKNIKIIYTLSKKTDDYFEHGRIDDVLIKKYLNDYKDAKYFAVGSESFEFSIFNTLLGMGIKEENIFKENFPGY